MSEPVSGQLPGDIENLTWKVYIYIYVGTHARTHVSWSGRMPEHVRTKLDARVRPIARIVARMVCQCIFISFFNQLGFSLRTARKDIVPCFEVLLCCLWEEAQALLRHVLQKSHSLALCFACWGVLVLLAFSWCFACGADLASAPHQTPYGSPVLHSDSF